MRSRSAELEAHARRLPRPGRHGGRLGHRRRPALRAAQGHRRRRADLRPEHPAGPRGRAGLRRRCRHPARRTDPRDAVPSTSSASCWSTTGPPATCRPGSTCRWDRTWARASPPPCRPGWYRCSRWRPRGSPFPASDPRPLPYLRASAPWGLDVDLAVEWNGEVVSRPPYREMYWSPAQMLAHMTVNGASTRTGDLFASGTVSGPAARAGLPHRAHLGRPGTDRPSRRAADVPARRRHCRPDRHRTGRGRRPYRLRRGPRPDPDGSELIGIGYRCGAGARQPPRRPSGVAR